MRIEEYISSIWSNSRIYTIKSSVYEFTYHLDSLSLWITERKEPSRDDLGMPIWDGSTTLYSFKHVYKKVEELEFYELIKYISENQIYTMFTTKQKDGETLVTANINIRISPKNEREFNDIVSKILSDKLQKTKDELKELEKLLNEKEKE